MNLNHVETILVDLNNQKSVKAMCEKATILINCVGPVNKDFS